METPSTETERVVNKEPLYAVVNNFLISQWVGQVILNLASQCLVALVALVAKACLCRNLKRDGEEERERTRRQLAEQQTCLDRVNKWLEEEAKKQMQTEADSGATADSGSVVNRGRRPTDSNGVSGKGKLPRAPHDSIDCDGESTEERAAENDVPKNCATVSTVEDIDMIVVVDKDLSKSEVQQLRNAMPNEHVIEISGSHIFKTSISVEKGELVGRLHRLLQNLASLNLSESCTIQLGHWGVFDQGTNRLERFMEKNLPTLVMCTRITSDKISICGLHLKVQGEGEGPVCVYAATAERKHALDVTWDEHEIVAGVERGVAMLPSELALTDVAVDIWIYATKTVPIGETRKPTFFRSEAIRLSDIENVTSLNWPFLSYAIIGSIVLVLYELTFSKGLLQTLVMASVWLTTWGLFQLRQPQLTRLVKSGKIRNFGLLPFELLKNISWGRESSSRSQGDRTINSVTPDMLQTQSQAALTQVAHEISRWTRVTGQLLQKLSDEDDEDNDDEKDDEDNDDHREKLNALQSALEAPDWKWDRYETLVRNGRKVRKRLVERKETSWRAPFIVTQENGGDDDMRVFVTLYSPCLIDIVAKLIPDTTADTDDEPDIDGQTLFLARDEMKRSLRAATGELHLHLSHLVRFVEEEYKNTLLQLQKALEQKRINWDILWTVLAPGEVVSYKCELTTRHVSGTILRVKKKYGELGSKWFKIYIRVRDFDLQSYKECTVSRNVMQYTDKQPFSSLDVAPLKYLDDADRKEREERFRQQGEMFYRLMLKEAGQPVYMEYKGSIVKKRLDGGCWVREQIPGDGRVMVDLKSFARMNPGYPMGYAEPPCDLVRGAAACPKIPRPDTESLMKSPAFVYGFSLSRKLWGCFDVCGFRDIVFSDKPFEDLVMEEGKKEMLLRIATNCTFQQSVRQVGIQSVQQVDNIDNKGGGFIILCYGPPGGGKTLTAEGLAEKLHRPLYSVNAFELPSTDSIAMELRLLNIFELSYTWQAILLLDEADVYMESRSSTSSPHTNASTGIFLRQLEYYSGIMFLTTNRAKCFDAAFCSRITMSIYYPPLDEEQRSQIWRQMLNKVGFPDRDIDYSELASHPFNGREIRNIINAAKVWGETGWDISHVKKVIEIQLREAEHLNKM